MTKNRLEDFRRIKNEIKAIEICLESLEREKESFMVSDISTGSSSVFPYQAKTMKINGYNADCLPHIYGIEEKIKARKKQLNAKKKLYQNELQEIESWLERIEDTEIGALIRFYYICGFTWMDISEKIGMNGDGSTERKKVDRFLKNAI